MWFVYVLGLILAIAAALIAAAVAAIVYALGLPGVYLTALTEVLSIRSPRLPRPGDGPSPPADGDPAVLGYFYGPAMADARHGLAVAYRHGKNFWRWGSDLTGYAIKGETTIMTIPFGFGGKAGMVVGATGGTIIAAGCALVYLLVVAVGAAVVRATGAALRVADSTLLRIKNIRIVCPDCGEWVPYPGYVCPSERCERRHRDVRPGRYGVIRRYCRCGEPMKTLLLLGSAGMAAFCPYCEKLLGRGRGEVREIVLVFFGATGAGKTRLASAMATQLMTWAKAEHLDVKPGDRETEASLNQAEQMLRSSRATAPTPVQLPRSLVIRVSSSRASRITPRRRIRITRILHLFDAAGEPFQSQDPRRIEELRYLRQARAFILVIDPVPVAASYASQPGRGPAEQAAPSPDQAYHHTYQQIEAMGVPLSDARLAVAFSRADMVAAPGHDVTGWARRELGLGNLIISARQNFKEAGFFCTAAIATPDTTAGAPGTVVHESITKPLRWLLTGSGLTLPGGDDERSD